MAQVRSSCWLRLVSLVLVALLFSGLVDVRNAWALHDLLFAFWVVNAPSVTTFVTEVNPFFNGDPGDPADFMHYQYFFKAATAPVGDACQSYSTFGHTSQNDIVTFDVSGFISTEPLLSDTTSGSAGGLGLNVNPSGNLIGYLLMINQGPGVVEGLDAQPHYGEALIVDVANGGLWGYLPDDIPFFDDAICQTIECIAADPPRLGDAHVLPTGTRRPVHLLPTSLATTDFIVTPLGSAMASNANNRTALQ